MGAVGRIVVTGAAGQVGRFLATEAARRGHSVAAFTSGEWDITDPQRAQAIVEPGDVVVNCAAFTAVDAAEDRPERAHEVNAVGPGIVARACADAGARLVHVSTDYVFGAETRSEPYDLDDVPAPCNAYGRAKLAGEQAVHAALPNAHVVRTAWVYTGTGKDFVAVMREKAAGGDTVDVVADQIGSPTYVGDLVDALLQVAAGTIDAPLLHAANAGAASRYDQARAVFAGVGADVDRVRAVGSDRHPRPAPPPSDSVLSADGSTAAGLTPLRPWQDALAAALRT